MVSDNDLRPDFLILRFSKLFFLLRKIFSIWDSFLWVLMIHKSTGEKRIMVIPHPLFYYPTKELTFRQVYTR